MSMSTGRRKDDAFCWWVLFVCVSCLLTSTSWIQSYTHVSLALRDMCYITCQRYMRNSFGFITLLLYLLDYLRKVAFFRTSFKTAVYSNSTIWRIKMFTHWWILANDHWFKILTQMDGFPIASYTTWSGMWMRHKQYWHNNSKRSDLSPKPIAGDFLNFRKTSWNKMG